MQEAAVASPKMAERIKQMKQVHAEALKIYTSRNERSVEYFITFYKNGAIKTLTQAGEKLKQTVSITKHGVNLFDYSKLQDRLFDLHIYASYALIMKITHAKLTKNHYEIFASVTTGPVASDKKESNEEDCNNDKEEEEPTSPQLGNLLGKLFKKTSSTYSDIFEGKGKIYHDTPEVISKEIIIHQGVPLELYGTDSDAIEQLQKEGLELFIKKNTDYGDAFAEYGIIGVIVRIEDKLKRLASITSNKKIQIADEGINDTLADLFNYTAMALMLYNE
jgi:hypothetical protein